MNNENINQISTNIFALGGIEEIGKNMYIVEHRDEIFIVDCGIKFADPSLLGVNAIICSFEYLIQNKEKIVGLIVTHAHEDHIGGIPYLLKTIPINKIYGAKLTIGIISRKLKEHKNLNAHTFEVIDDEFKINTKHFRVDFFRVCHSIPDSFGVCFETENGKIVSTGDFRFDFSSQTDEADINKIADIGRRNIDILLCEATNSETKGFSVSEKYIINELRKIINDCKGRVFISSFASSLGRIEEIIGIGINANRKICLCGRSMETNVETSIKVGFLNVDKEQFFETRDINKYKPEEIMVLSTGSQGEEMAALSQIARGKHPWIVLQPSDTIIMSSNPIPGNRLNVEELVNQLSKSGATIILNSPKRKIHASGHGTQTEQQLMIKLINPQYLIPIHGEYKMLKLLKQNAIDAGIHPDNFIQIVNGQKVKLVNHVAIPSNEFVDASVCYVDGNKINSDTTGIMKYRTTLSQDGIFSITVLVDRQSKRVLDLPNIFTRGSFFAKDSTSLITKIAYTIKENIESLMQKSQYIVNNNEIRKLVENNVTYFIWKNKKKHPLVRTTIFDINKNGY